VESCILPAALPLAKHNKVKLQSREDNYNKNQKTSSEQSVLERKDLLLDKDVFEQVQTIFSRGNDAVGKLSLERPPLAGDRRRT
jgi:hypothetical protein